MRVACCGLLNCEVVGGFQQLQNYLQPRIRFSFPLGLAESLPQAALVEHDQMVQASRRMVPITHSTYAHCHAESTCLIPIAFACSINSRPKIGSRSSSRYRGAVSRGKASQLRDKTEAFAQVSESSIGGDVRDNQTLAISRIPATTASISLSELYTCGEIRIPSESPDGVIASAIR
jgi:hypothetical protein